MDVSKRAAELLGFDGKGTARVRLEVLEKESRILAAAAKRGEDTTRMTMADMEGQQAHVTGTPVVIATGPAPAEAAAASAKPAAAPVKLAPAAGGDDTMPESLRTPTITVEELSGKEAAAAPAPEPVAVDAAPVPVPEPAPALAEGHMNKGKFMPDPVVRSAPVRPTGIFVQAGSFAVRDNAEKFAKKLKLIAPTSIDPATVNGRQFYRVKLGPIESVAEADNVLEKVIHQGGNGAKVIK
jgi:rare lipoprotein A